MSTQIKTAFVQMFTRGITHLAQQRMSRFRGKVREESIAPGDRAFFDQLGQTTMTKISTRHADTPLIDTPHSRRVVFPATFKHADLVDKADKLRTLNDPTNEYVVAFARAAGRAIDDEIIAAATGTAYTGVSGATSETWASLSSAQEHGTGSGMTLAKIITSNKVLRAAENDPEEGFYQTYSQEQLEDVLNDSTITSADYNSVRLLQAGTISSFMGFEWVHSERLGTTSSERNCFSWAKNCLLLGVAENPTGRISERADKNYSMQVYYEMDLGSTRMESTGVVNMLCTE